MRAYRLFVSAGVVVAYCKMWAATESPLSQNGCGKNVHDFTYLGSTISDGTGDSFNQGIINYHSAAQAFMEGSLCDNQSEMSGLQCNNTFHVALWSCQSVDTEPKAS